jgi:uncharacterized repeat protein (TIGR02543 family)
MKKKGVLSCIITILIGIFFAGGVWAVPPPPHTIYGTVKQDGANVPSGTVVSAWIGGVQYRSTATILNGGESVYALDVPGDDTDTPTIKEGGGNGEIISFMVGSDWAPQTVAFSSGSTTNLNLALTTQYTLTTSVSPYNGGSVSKSPNKSAYNSGEQVTLTVMAYSGYQFSSWSGDATGANSTIYITMNSNKTVTANFTQVQVTQYTLSVSSIPSNGGYVTVYPNKYTYAEGEQVTITATANSGYQFSSWSGDATGVNSTIYITMNSNKTVTANFTQSISETITPPAMPAGPSNGVRNTTYTYTTGGASSSLGHQVQYRFDWGDGTMSPWLSVGSVSASRVWNYTGTYYVRAQARCASDWIESAWSGALTVVITSSQQLPLIGLLESPVDGSRISGIMTIHGWALDGKGIQKVELFIDEQLIGNIPYGSTRRDVQASYTNYPNAENSGFGMIWNYSILTSGPHEIKVRVYNQDGVTKDLISNMVVGQFHGEYVEGISPSERWIYNLSVTVNGVTKRYDVKLQWSNENQNFVITEIIPK